MLGTCFYEQPYWNDMLLFSFLLTHLLIEGRTLCVKGSAECIKRNAWCRETAQPSVVHASAHLSAAQALAVLHVDVLGTMTSVNHRASIVW